MTAATGSAPARTEKGARRGPTARRKDSTASRHGRGGRVLFTVPFVSAMTDGDLARLGRSLDLWTHVVQKMRPDPNSPGVTRLDHFSGVFLEHGESEGQWVLEARTWGNPASEAVREWQLLAVGAARELDPSVRTPMSR